MLKRAAPPETNVRVHFDTPLPARLAVGAGAVALLRGFVDTRHVDGFTVELGDERQVLGGRGRLRFDLDAIRPPLGLFLPIRIAGRYAGTTTRVRISLREGGHEQPILEQPVEFVARTRAPIAIDTPIAICLATYNPDEELLRRQLDSLRAQTRRDWTCIIHDDASAPERFAAIERLTAGDERFRLFRSETNRGFYRNFEAALELVPSSTPYVALCDQDDVWRPDKLEATIAALEREPAAQLAYCDMRIVDGSGRVYANTYWSRRRNNYRHFDTLLLANTVTGAASVFRGELLEHALPFPPQSSTTYHDHWLACVAFVAGGIAYVDRPLYDYVQHHGNVIGHSKFGPLTVAGALKRHAFNTVEMLVKPRQAWTNVWVMLAYYHEAYRPMHIVAETLRLRFPAMDAGQRATLDLFDERPRRAFELMTSRHVDICRRGDTTDGCEFKMGMGKLLHEAVTPWFPALIEAKARVRDLLGLSAQ